METITPSSLNRRGFLTVCSFALGLCTIPKQLLANQEKITWSGTALGANATMTLYNSSQIYAKTVIKECVEEIKRLENIFSLFDNKSAIVQLNRNGILENPPKELLDIIHLANTVSLKSDGAFDITVQPLWEYYSSFFYKNGTKNQPDFKEIKRVKKLLGWEKIILEKNRIEFKQKSMAITLNGIAQGYITDKITRLLKQRGFTNTLINLGEIRAIGKHPTGRLWNIKAPFSKESQLIHLDNQAVASSGGYGTQFSKTHHHLFNPHTALSANFINAVSIKAPTAVIADALSTAVAVMPKDKSEKLLSLYPDVRAYIS